MDPFELDPRLRDDTFDIGRLALCRVLLMNDANHPWVILVPERAGVSEIYQLDEADQLQLARESSFVARSMAELYRADKLNVAALGNVVRQLHVHHVARFTTDPAWPSPVWGRVPPKPYAHDAAEREVQRLRSALITNA